MAEIIINPTPKQEFQLNFKACSAHRNMFSTVEVQTSLRTALAQYQRIMADQHVAEGNLAAVNHFKSQGAHEFVSILMNLAEAPKNPVAKTTPGNLNQAV